MFTYVKAVIADGTKTVIVLLELHKDTRRRRLKRYQHEFLTDL